MNKRKIRCCCIGIAIISALSSFNGESVYAAWKSDDKGDMYIENGCKVTGWKHLDYVSKSYGTDSSPEDDTTNYKVWFYFDSNGYMKNGWIKDKNKWYYLKEDGSMAKNCSVNGYSLGSDGSWIENGGWKKDSIGWWYSYGPSNGYARGWKAFDDINDFKHDEYYMNDGSIWYYFNQGGYMKTGWVKSYGKWYYLNSDGSMARNVTIDGYIIGDDGTWIEKFGKVNYSQNLITRPEKSSYPLGTTEMKYYIINNMGKMIKTFCGTGTLEKNENGKWIELPNKLIKRMQEDDSYEPERGPIDIKKVYEERVQLTDFEGFDSNKPGKYRFRFDTYLNQKNSVLFEEFELK